MAVCKTPPRLFAEPSLPTGICPGCGYGIIKHMLADVLEDLAIDEEAIGVYGIGCTGYVTRHFDIDWLWAQHGRAQLLPRQ